MKYEVTHSLISGADKNYRQGDILDAEELTGTGMDIAFLRRNGAVRPLKGTGGPGEEDAEEILVDPLQGTDPTTPGAMPPQLRPIRLAPDAAATDGGAVTVTKEQYQQALADAVQGETGALQTENDRIQAALTEKTATLAALQAENDKLKAQVAAGASATSVTDQSDGAGKGKS